MNIKDKIVLNKYMEMIPYNDSCNYLYDYHEDRNEIKSGTLICGLFSIDGNHIFGTFVYEKGNIPKNLAGYSILQEFEIDSDYKIDGVTFVKPIPQ